MFHSTNVSVNEITDSCEKAGSTSISLLEKAIYCLLDKHQLNASYFNNNSSSSNASINGEEETEDESNSKDIEESEQHSFDCLMDGCTARYRSHSNLLLHFMIGKHKMKLEKHSLTHKSKTLLHQNLTINHLCSTPLLSITVVSSTNIQITPSLSQNWAIQKIKKTICFNDKQKQSSLDKFNEGVRIGSKW